MAWFRRLRRGLQLAGNELHHVTRAVAVEQRPVLYGTARTSTSWRLCTHSRRESLTMNLSS